MAESGAIAEGEERRERIITNLVAAGYRRTEPPILQRPEVFLDLSGKDFGGPIFLTSDPTGAEFCLRPEYTISVCRNYIASPAVRGPAAFCYCGSVFRHRPGEPSEFIEMGIENFGRTDAGVVDAEILALALETAERAGANKLETLMGDLGLLKCVLEALDLPPAWLKRIRHGHRHGQALSEILARSTNGMLSDHSGVLTALAGADQRAARELVKDLLSIAGFSSVGGRTTVEIADRFLEQASMWTGSPIPAEKYAVLEEFFAIAGRPEDCSVSLRMLARDAKLDLQASLDAFDERLSFMVEQGVSTSQIRFSASFGRDVDYYSGYVFETYNSTQFGGRPVIGGGRYDGLLRLLGAREEIPAVGAAIWPQRIESVGDAI